MVILWQSNFFLCKTERMIIVYTVYEIENVITNKKYVGVTKREPRVRFREHLNNKKDILCLEKNKYGKNSFRLVILEKNISEKDRDDKERYWIKREKTLFHQGYNFSIGGIKNKSISEEGKKRLSSCNKGLLNPKCDKIILMIDPISKDVLRTFESSREAGRFLGNENKYRSILYSLKRNDNKKCHGYIWKYQENNLKAASTIHGSVK